MTRVFYILLLLLPLFTTAQTGEMRVYTVAGSLTATALGDGGPATAASLSATEGIWMDANCNLYISDMGHSLIRKVNTVTGIITTVAGIGSSGYSGDGGPATDAQINAPYGIYVDPIGSIYFADIINNRVQRIDAVSNIITTIAGGGASLGDGEPATNAQLNGPQNVYNDGNGNIYIGEKGRIRKVTAATGNISTIAGTGIQGLAGDGGMATNAQIMGCAGMVFDKEGDLFFADRGNARVRKVDKANGIITTVAGTTSGYSGDGSPATNAQIAGPIGLAIDIYGNLVISDNSNNLVRRVDATSGIISTISGVGFSTGSTAEGVSATSTQMHPEFIYLDLSGNIFYSNYGTQIRKIDHYNPGLSASGSVCGPPNEVPVKYLDNNVSIFPNPTNDLLNINNIKTQSYYRLLSIVGTTVQQGSFKEGNNNITLQSLPTGMYLLEITDAERGKTITKVIKQ